MDQEENTTTHTDTTAPMTSAIAKSLRTRLRPSAGCGGIRHTHQRCRNQGKPRALRSAASWKAESLLRGNSVEAYACAVSRMEVVTVIRRLINRVKERRDVRRAGRLATAPRRAADGYDEPPMGFP